MRSAVPVRSIPRPGARDTIGQGRRPLAGDLLDNAHSRRVARLKFILPVIGAALLMLVVAWPRLAPLWERMRFAIPAIDLREARELRMLNPRYAGTDRENRPFVITAAVGRQVPDRSDLMSLEQPRAEMKMHNGAVVVLTAATGIYQSQTQLLDLFGDVTVTRDDATRFTSDTARVDVAHNTAQGDDPVEGHGPTGDIKAKGFRIFDNGGTIVFTGRSDLLLKSVKEAGVPTVPPAVPPAVAAAASAVEAVAKPLLAQAAKAEPPAKPAIKPPAKPKAAPSAHHTAHHAEAHHRPAARHRAPVRPVAAKRD
jgi:lipopolysaccharide export system protein LptC